MYETPSGNKYWQLVVSVLNLLYLHHFQRPELADNSRKRKGSKQLSTYIRRSVQVDMLQFTSFSDLCKLRWKPSCQLLRNSGIAKTSRKFRPSNASATKLANTQTQIIMILSLNLFKVSFSKKCL